MQHSKTVLLGVLGFLAVLAVPTASSSGPDRTADAVRVEATLAHPLMLAGTTRSNYLKVAVTGVDTRPGRRAPVNVAIVLDRSGSMSGHKIEQAKRAAITAIDQLRDDDIVAVVTYASNVSVLVPATKLADRNSLYQRIRSITAGGNTALFAGVSKGAQEVRKFAEDNRVSSIVLLSDGLANVGPSSPGEVADLGGSLGREGITVTTIGLGLDFNEDLMAQLAVRSEGNHFFVEDATDLAAVFATEFGDAVSATAQDTRILIECAPGIRPIRVLGREARIHGQRVEAYLSQVYRDQTKFVLLEVEVPAGSVDQRLAAANVSVSFRDLDRQTTQMAHATASLRFTDSQEEFAKNEHRDTMISAVTLIAVENNKVAVALRDQGKIDDARAAFLANEEWALSNSMTYDSPELKTYAGTQSSAADNLDPKEWNKERKIQVEQNMKNSSGREKTPKQSDKSDED